MLPLHFLVVPITEQGLFVMQSDIELLTLLSALGIGMVARVGWGGGGMGEY
jgi:hypothetical protein